MLMKYRKKERKKWKDTFCNLVQGCPRPQEPHIKPLIWLWAIFTVLRHSTSDFLILLISAVYPAAQKGGGEMKVFPFVVHGRPFHAQLRDTRWDDFEFTRKKFLNIN
ncbi:hypothetical protein R5R35_007385 [Gryllus longicercus]|uniref:Uncharacterized protein n=1 Tax=Gryllus longicercus TaxID=2509291 RepID=A0AAN9VAN9_9ORTH